MRLLIALALMASVCFFFTPAFAQEGELPAGPTPTWVDGSEAPSEVASDPGSNADLLAKYEALKAAWDAIQEHDPDGGVSKKVLWFLLLAAAANLLISGIKRVMKLTSRGKKFLPWVALGLGVVAGFFSYYALGVGLFAAFWYGAGPPASVLVQELIHPVKSDG